MYWPPFSQTIVSSNWPLIWLLPTTHETRALQVLWFLVSQPAVLAYQISHATHVGPVSHAAYCNSNQQRPSLPVWCVHGSILDDWLVFLTQLSVPAIIQQIQHQPNWNCAEANISHAVHGPQYHCQWHNDSSWCLHLEPSGMCSHHAASFTSGYSADIGLTLSVVKNS